MTLLDIVFYPDERLTQQTAPVEAFDEELATLLDNMFETMYEADGIGLAAPQIGVMKQITVIDVSPEGEERLEFINPVITAHEGTQPSEEGCLSIPGYRDTVKRAERITVEAYNRTGEKFTLEADGILGICLQHEIDHLNGVLFTDHLSRLKKEFFKRWAKKNDLV